MTSGHSEKRGSFLSQKANWISSYEEGFFEDDSYYVSLFCVGKSIEPTLSAQYPKIPQNTWEGVLEFIYNRFEKYERFKRDHSQWDCDGKQLWNSYKCTSKSEFKKEIISCLEQ